MTTENKTLTKTWELMGGGPLNIVRVSGLDFWAFNGASPPSDDSNFIPLDVGYSYGGTENTYARTISTHSLPVVVSVTPIV